MDYKCREHQLHHLGWREWAVGQDSAFGKSSNPLCDELGLQGWQERQVGLKVSSVTAEGLAGHGHPWRVWVDPFMWTNKQTNGRNPPGTGEPLLWPAALRLLRDTGMGFWRGWFWVWSFTPSGALSACQAANASRRRREYLQNSSWCCGDSGRGWCSRSGCEWEELRWKNPSVPLFLSSEPPNPCVSHSPGSPFGLSLVSPVPRVTFWSPLAKGPWAEHGGSLGPRQKLLGRILRGTIEHYQTQLQSYFPVCCRYWALIAVIVTVTELGTLAVIRTVVLSCVTIWREARKEANEH